MSEPTANDLWHWLLACLDCGEEHKRREAPCGGRCADRHLEPHVTWGSPADGHPYRQRLIMWGSTPERLRDKWNREAG